MSKTWIFALLLGALLCLAASPALAETRTTVLVYLCGTTDMQPAVQEDLGEMIDAGTGSDVNLLVLAGGAPEWEVEGLAGNTRNLLVIRNGAMESVTDWGVKSMGSADCLAEFLKYGIQQYPADRTVVILWDHGGGSEGGLCFDETADDDGLTLVEIDQALTRLQVETGGFHIDIFGCDACMMATYELAVILSHYDIDCFVASEELEPGSGWEYTTWLKAIQNDPGISDEALCETIVNSFMAKGLQEDPDDYMTLSAVSLPAVRNLESSMEDFSAHMVSELESGNLTGIRRGRSRMYTLGAFDDGSWDMVDLGTVLNAYAQFAPESAAQARRALNSAVITSRYTDNLNACSGLSIFIPQDTTGEYAEYSDGMDLSAYIPTWTRFVSGYAAQLNSSGYSFTASSPSVMPAGASFTACDNGQCYTGSYDWYDWNDETEEYDWYEYSAQEYQISDSDYGFSITIPAEELAYLDSVEGMLMMDISDEETDGYIEFGLMQNNMVDWDTGRVYSLFDGKWPVFGEQPVPLYDQVVSDTSRRSLIPAKVNGEATYLVVDFPAGSQTGRILGTNAGYDDNGLPIRTTTPLRNGDEIVPVYMAYVADAASDEDYEEMEFDGDAIFWQEGMTVTFEDLSDDEEPMEAMFCFVLNDIYGDYTMSEIISFII